MEVKRNTMFKEMISVRWLSFVISLLLIVSVAGCESKSKQGQINPHLLVTAADMAKNMDKWVVIDCRNKDAYDEGHIPGAINLGDKCESLIRDSKKISDKIGDTSLKEAISKGTIDKSTIIAGFSIKPAEELEKIFAGAGITHDKTVVIYSNHSDMMSGAHLIAFFILEYLGHQDVRVLDGGIEAWIAEGRSLEQKENKLPPSDFKAKIAKNKLVTTDEVLKIAKGEIKDVQLVDARLIAEYIGKAVSPPGAPLEKAIERGGRIPKTSINVPHVLQYQDTKTLKVKPIDRLERMYLPLDKNKRTIVYCVTGTRASLNYLVLRMLGFKDVGIYYDSWLVWGNDKSLPIEKGPR